MATISCSHCHQLVDSQAITCPYCQVTLKAYGHPGVTVYRSTDGEYLCKTCVYHQDDSCNFPKRPYAEDCTLYQNLQEHLLELERQAAKSSVGASVRGWLKHHQGLVWILGLLLLCFVIALMS